MKKAGILLHISSLNSDFGIGDFGKAAYDFVDFLSKSGQSLWQILPIGYIGLGNSPYQCYSSKALNPYFIDPDIFVESGLCEKVFIDRFRTVQDKTNIDYDDVFKKKDDIFKKAFKSFNKSDEEYSKFKAEHAGWLDEFALFIVLLKKTPGLTIREFDADTINKDDKSLDDAFVRYEEEIEREKFLQFIAFGQWFKLKKYANEHGILIVGDIPIYLSFDSVEVWMERELFKIRKSLELTHVSGVPPDKLSDDGQIWGNPIYDWKYHKKTGYQWWVDRIQFALLKFDIIRIDHFRGFSKYYAIREPFDDAHEGRWKKGPGFGLFRIINSIFDSSRIIAEDLGYITKDVRKLIRRTGYAGMKIAQFGFNGDRANEHLPGNYESNTYVYTGTHDNNTLMGWFDDISKDDMKNLRNEIPGVTAGNVNEIIISILMKSDSQAVIIPMQDYLRLPGNARMNTPSTLDGNWEWRMTDIPAGLDDEIRKLTELRR